MQYLLSVVQELCYKYLRLRDIVQCTIIKLDTKQWAINFWRQFLSSWKAMKQYIRPVPINGLGRASDFNSSLRTLNAWATSEFVCDGTDRAGALSTEWS